jgi:hypothetical protein
MRMFQMMFVIVAFSEHHVERYVAALSRVPYVGRSLQAPFKDFLRKQKASLHSVGAHEVSTHVRNDARVRADENLAITRGVWLCCTRNGRVLSHKHCQLVGPSISCTPVGTTTQSGTTSQM